jgi:aromatic ring-opening dioxygenase catalytic subunit (LigB family)
VHAFPDAAIPVVQLSINANKPLDYHLELGAKLAAMRRRGVLIVAGGSIVHNLDGMDWKLADEGDGDMSLRKTPVKVSASPLASTPLVAMNQVTG